MANKLSVIIPSRIDTYLNPTIKDLMAKAEDEVEVIVVLDGYWPEEFVEDKRVIYLHQGIFFNNRGMRDCINAGMRVATGEYVMKIDEHCMMDQGYDKKLKADCDDNWVVIPRRWRLNADKWILTKDDEPKDNRPPIDYMFIAYPFERPYDIVCGLHGAEWKARWWERRDILIDDTMASQGSCYFMKKSYWEYLGEMDGDKYGQFTHEAQEIGFKCQFSGGRQVVNKKTWYAHYHKGQKGKGFRFCNAQWAKLKADNEKGRRYCIDYWTQTKNYTHNLEWLVKKFWPVPTWPEDWKVRLEVDKFKDYRYK